MATTTDLGLRCRSRGVAWTTHVACAPYACDVQGVRPVPGQLAHCVCVLAAQYVATVLAVGTECDIACLTVKDDDFWDGTEAVSFGELPHLQDSILVIGCAAGNTAECSC